ncbi:hypothetical protein GRF29_19g3238339 [Pseudopithomyces chartarum]|uniref:Thioesterase domain-containing protein n=1 Tax=Pseudopithomyces chartarum TaxID=1892770 RepID=A0AAN6RLH7_9PLEO|nr:hypothetical protein GRF29_19g3238339 [Pseudopithomyces chartarum]
MRPGYRTNPISIIRQIRTSQHVNQRFKSSKAFKKEAPKASQAPTSTAPPPHPATTPPSSPPPPQSSPPKPRRPILLYAWYGIVLFGGVSAGLTVRNFFHPALPSPGSREDELALAALTSDADQLDVVKWMRSQIKAAEDTEDSKGNGWVELDVRTHIAESTDDEHSTTRPLTSQTLAGSRALGVQRAFWNADTRELVAAVWIGTALSGWPTLAHGGAIATIFEDCMARMIVGPDAPLGMYTPTAHPPPYIHIYTYTDPQSPTDSAPRPTALSITYAKPTYSTNFYVLRANFSHPRRPPKAPPVDPEPQPAKSWLPSWKDLTKKEQGGGRAETQKEMVEIIGTLESEGGDLTVRVKGTFEVGR